jgi:HK97 family phage portal protein
MAFWHRILARDTKPADAGRRYVIGRSSAGVYVREEDALQIPAVWAGTVRTSAVIAQLPVHVMQKLPNGKREKQSGHAVSYILNERFNPEMPAFIGKQTLIAHAMIWGNGYAEIERDNAGRMVWLWPIEPYRVTPKRSPEGGLYYEVSNDTAAPVNLRPENVLHIRQLALDGITGLSPVQKAQQAMGIAIAQETHAAAFFGNGASIGNAVRIKGKAGVDFIKRMREQFEGLYRGASRAHRTLFLDDDADIKELGTSPKDSQLIEGRKFSVAEMARLLNTPPHIIGDLDRATNNNIEQQAREFLTLGLAPWIRQLEEEIGFKCFGQNRGALYVKFNVNALMRGDAQARAEFYTKMFLCGAFSVNMILELEDMDGIGPEGDLHLVQGQLVPLDKIRDVHEAALQQQTAAPKPAEPGEEPPEPGADPQAFAEVMTMIRGLITEASVDA